MSEYISMSAVDKWLNFQLLCKPEQSGKTFIMIQHIIKDLSDPIHGKEIINFILCDNNLLLTKQTSGRVTKDLSKYIHQGEVYIELSSHSRTNYHGVESVFSAILDPIINARNIICCTNGSRMEDIERLITLINSSIFTVGKFHFNVWLDEADKFIKFIDNTLCPIVNSYTNVNIKLITATPQSLFQKYKYMNVLPLENTTSDEYHGWGDNSIRIIEKEGGCQVFAEHILTKVAHEEIQPGTKWFIPGLNSKKSHEDIKDICLDKGMAVICVNSDGIVLTLPVTLERVQYTKDDNFNSKIKEIYTEKRLDRFACVITGYICIGRGITIMSENFMIDYAILSHYSNKNEASQLAGRVKGNIKKFTCYNPENPPVIFTKEEFNSIAIEWEQKSRALAQLAFEKEQNGLPTVVNKTEFGTCGTDHEFICEPNLFNNFDEVKAFLISKESDMKTKTRCSEESVIHERDGYFISSRKLKQGKTVSHLTKEDRLTITKANEIVASFGISSTKKGNKYLILPVYETEDTPGNEFKFQVRYIKFKPVVKPTKSESKKVELIELVEEP